MIEKIKELGIEYTTDDAILEEYSEDKSIFKIKPKIVTFPNKRCFENN